MRYPFFFSFFLSAFLIQTLQAQCPTSGTISANCTSTNLTISGNTLNVNAGVTVTVTGTLTINNSGVINGTGATFNIGNFTEAWGTLNTLSGGTYNMSGNFTTGNGGDFAASNVTFNLSNNPVSISNGTNTFTNVVISGASTFTTNVASISITGGSVTTSGNFTIQNATVSNATLSAGGRLLINSGTTTFSNSTINAGVNFANNSGQTGLEMNGGGILNLNNGSSMNVKGDVINNEWYINNSSATVTGNFDNAGSEILVLSNNGSLSVGGNFNNSGSGSVTSQSNSFFEVGGNYNNTGNGSTTAAGGGVIVVGGDFNNTNGSTTVNGGGFQVNGSFSGNTPAGDAGNCQGGSGGCCGTACTTLPVVLKSFDLFSTDKGVKISWVTATEINNDYFELERSVNGLQFEKIGLIKGNGNSTEMIEYHFVDIAAVPGLNYYRLTQFDYDGQFEVFDIKVINYTVSTKISIFPTILRQEDDQITLIQLSRNDAPFEFFLYDLAGRSLPIYVSQIASGYQISIQRKTNDQGIYLLKGNLGQTVINQKIILK